MTSESATMIRGAVEHNPPLSFKGMMERLFSYWFDGFVYNQIWEDPRVDLEALRLDGNSRVMTISSGGCNILNYLIRQPDRIHVVDLNIHHLNLASLKMAALRYLPAYQDFLDFFGHADKPGNLELYRRYIEPNLEPNARAYWEGGTRFRGKRIEYFTKNFYNHGAMGYFIRFIHWLTKRYADNPQALLEARCGEERARLFEERFSPFFDKKLIKFISKLPVLFYSLGIPPQQFEEVKKQYNGQLHEMCRERVRRLVCQFPVEDNYFAWQALSRRYDTENRRAIPDYLREEHFPVLRGSLDRVNLNLTSTTRFLKTQPENSLDRFVLLDSQDWMNADEIHELWSEIARVGIPGSRIIFRTGSNSSPVERSLKPDLLDRFEYDRERSEELFQQDRSAIYGGFHLYILRD